VDGPGVNSLPDTLNLRRGFNTPEAEQAKALIVQCLPPVHDIPAVLYKPDEERSGYCEAKGGPGCGRSGVVQQGWV